MYFAVLYPARPANLPLIPPQPYLVRTACIATTPPPPPLSLRSHHPFRGSADPVTVHSTNAVQQVEREEHRTQYVSRGATSSENLAGSAIHSGQFSLEASKHHRATILLVHKGRFDLAGGVCPCRSWLFLEGSGSGAARLGVCSSSRHAMAMAASNHRCVICSKKARCGNRPYMGSWSRGGTVSPIQMSINSHGTCVGVPNDITAARSLPRSPHFLPALPMAPSLPVFAFPALPPFAFFSGSLRLPVVLLTILAGPKKLSRRPWLALPCRATGRSSAGLAGRLQRQ